MASITVEYLRQQRSGAASARLLALLQQKAELPPKSATKKPEVAKPTSIRLDRRAEIALRTLTPEDQKIVNASINRLKLSLSGVLSSGQAKSVNGQESLYVMKVSDLRILFLLKNKEIEIEDIYSQARLDNIFG